MTPIRQQLAYVRPKLLQQRASSAEDPRVRAGLLHWVAHHLPLVVTRQDPASVGGPVKLGLPLPTRWDRLRVSVQVDLFDIMYLADFPTLLEVASQSPQEHREPWAALNADLVAINLQARVYGSHGWQHLSGLQYTHARSDLDILIPVRSIGEADLAAQRLETFDGDQKATPRLDGELVFQGGASVAWREWMPWRMGRTRQILVKQPEGAVLAHDTSWQHAP